MQIPLNVLVTPPVGSSGWVVNVTIPIQGYGSGTAVDNELGQAMENALILALSKQPDRMGAMIA